MKKAFAFLTILAMVFAVSCGKTDKPSQGGNNNENNENKEPEEQKYVQPITIDGSFSDWAALDASKVATATCNENANHTALKVVKVYADEYFVFVYFEWDKEQITWELDVEHVPFHIYINGDGDAKTGGFSDQWSDACMDTCFEGSVTDGTNIASYDPGVYGWIGDVNGGGWKWTEEPILAAGSGICQGAGVEGKYELQIIRDYYPVGKLADNFSIGFDIQQDWNSVGVLPNDAVTDDNPGGTAPSLQVKTVK